MAVTTTFVPILLFLASPTTDCLSVRRNFPKHSYHLDSRSPTFPDKQEMIANYFETKQNIADAFITLKQDLFESLKNKKGGNGGEATRNTRRGSTKKKTNHLPQRVDVQSPMDAINSIPDNGIRMGTPSGNIKQGDLTAEEIEFLINYLDEHYSLNSPHVQVSNPTIEYPQTSPSLHNDKYQNNNEPSLLDLLQFKDITSESSFNNPLTDIISQTFPTESLSTTPHPNSYADVPYIPAIHGNQNFVFPDYQNYSSIEKIFTDNTTRGEEQPNRLNVLRTSGGLSTCLSNSACTLGIALLVAAGTTGAIGLPLFFGKRRKRSTSEISDSQESVLRLLDHYHTISQNDENPFAGEVFNLLKGINPSNEDNDAWKSHQDSANSLMGRKVNLTLVQTDAQETNKDHEITNDTGIHPDSKNATKTFDVKINATGSSSDESNYNSKPIHFDLSSPIGNKVSKRSQIYKSRASYKLPITTTFSEDENTEELVEKLRARLTDYLSQIKEINNELNISSNYQNKEQLTKNDGSQVTKSEDSVSSQLNYLFNNDSKKTVINNDQTIENVDSNYNTEPHQSYSLRDIIQKLMSQGKDKRNPPSSTSTPPRESLNIDKLSQLLEQIGNKPNQNMNHENNQLSSLLNLALINQFAQKPHPGPMPVKPPYVPYQNPLMSPVIKNDNIVPIQTVNKILQSPNNDQPKIQSILSNLPQLISGPRPNLPKPFAPTVIQGPSVASSGSDTEHPIVSTKPSSTKSKLSPDTIRFYSLLCRAILQPEVPLNRVTAYIAEKCLVMRFTGILGS